MRPGTAALALDGYTEGVLPLDDPEQLARRLSLAEQRALRATRTLHDAIVAGREIVDVIVQDEFTHDVVLTCGDLWVVYDST